ncbi:MAG: hypothetical protein H0T62_07070 [Parachlamydiaceae bacterium]|nr:hypothetical protein [Parachlamydiaceae bacterium]
MSVSPMSAALISYTPLKCPMGFIKSKEEKNLNSISLEQTICPIPFSPSTDHTISSLYLNSITKIDQRSEMGDLLLTKRSLRIERQSQRRKILFHPLGLSDESTQSNGPVRIYSPKIYDDLKLTNGLNCLDIRSPIIMSHVSSGQKLIGEEIAETFQSEISFTTATDKKPVVATYGCGPCVALGGYDSTNKIAFIVHFSNPMEVRTCGSSIIYNFAKLVKEEITTPIQLHLRGGIEGQSEPIIEAIKIWINEKKDFPTEIASQDILDSGMGFNSKSLLTDSRTGFASEYDPMENPKRRTISDAEVMSAMMSAFDPQIKIAYTPK